MIISPPFLTVRANNQTDAAYVAACMTGDAPGAGSYPVSHRLNWHGGLHLTAPQGANGRLPVRAIADGTVVFVRQPTPLPADAAARRQHALGYYRGWTDNGTVVVRHETEIGEGANAQVTFYSIYQHLHTLRSTVRQGQQIYRKAELGQAGYIYGEPDRIQLEIVCDDANLQRLVGRANGELPITADGRTDSVYGELYFALPAGTEIFDRSAHAPRPQAPRGQPAPAVPAPRVVHTTTDPLFVGIRYAAGDATLATYTATGAPVGAPRIDNDYEYNLYTEATRIYPNCPSAGYELLRFGRVLGPDALNPAGAAHWRQIRHAGGEGWVNLNATAIHQFSDADFPQWRGWFLIDDAQDANSRCDSATIIRALDVDRDGTVTREEAEQRLQSQPIRDFMKRLLCKFPTEWDATTIEARWGWLRQGAGNAVTGDLVATEAESLTAADFDRLRAHLSALAFWNAGTIGIGGTHWHFDPRTFITHFRQCGWLSENEFAQCIPRNNYHLVGTAFRQQLVAGWNTALARSQRWANHLNACARKYVIPENKQRLAHFLSQCIEESGYLQFVVEGDGQNASYAPWYGRGLIQLTHLANYQEYGQFRGWLAQPGVGATFARLGWNPDQRIAQSDFACADSAGFYWVATTINAISTHMNSPADQGITAVDVLAVSRGVNGNVSQQNVNGLDIRVQLAVYLKYVLMDEVLPSVTPPTESVVFTWRNRSRPRPFTPMQHTINVILTAQRP